MPWLAPSARLHCQLPLAAFGPRDEEVGNIRAGDQQEHSDGTEHDPQYVSGVADHHVAERADDRLHVNRWYRGRSEAARELLRHAGQNALQVECGGRWRGAIAQARDGMVVERGGCDVRRIEPQRKPERRLRIGKSEARRHDTDNFAFQAVDDDVLTDDGRVAPELMLPETLSDDRYRGRPGLPSSSARVRPRCDRIFEDVKETAGCECGGDSRWR